jgi:hypothetical protein
LKPRFVAPRHPFASRPYSFRPLARGDLPLVATWLRTPEVVRWWGEPKRELVGAGAPLVVIDPDAENHRARRAYRKAGFRGDALVDTAAGSIVLMVFNQASEAARPHE